VAAVVDVFSRRWLEPGLTQTALLQALVVASVSSRSDQQAEAFLELRAVRMRAAFELLRQTPLSMRASARVWSCSRVGMR